MNNVYEAVRASIKSKLPAERVVDDQVVNTNRDEILNLIPFNVKRAINRLQNRSVIPPKHVQIPIEDAEPYVVDGEVQYRFLRLPEDFSEIIEFDPDTVENDYEFWPTVSNIDRMSKLKETPLYKVERLNTFPDSDGHEPVLILSPFPEDGSIHIKYKFKPSDTYIKNIEESYWNAIITEVERLLGLGNERDADDEAYQASRKWRQPKQRGKVRVRGSGFNVGRRRNRMRGW